MKACVDVCYRTDRAVAACVVFRDWTDHRATDEIVVPIGEVEPYRPGQFYLRELPCLLAVLKRVSRPLETIVVDGYVWLGEERAPGLGAHLYEAQRVPVIGVAKTWYRGTPAAEVARGRGHRPLYVTSVGLDVEKAAAHIRSMNGPFRIPTLLKRADQLGREACRRDYECNQSS